MTIIVLVDDVDMCNQNIQQAANHAIQCDGHTLHVIYNPSWRAKAGLTVNIACDNDAISISVKNAQYGFAIQDPIGIVISHLGMAHGGGGGQGAFERVVINDECTNTQDVPEILIDYYRAKWLRVSCCCLWLARAGSTAIVAIIGNFERCQPCDQQVLAQLHEALRC